MDAVLSEEIANRFIEFFNSYYPDQINEMFVSYPSKRSVMIDIANLEKFDVDLANELMQEPDMIIPIANSALLKLNPAIPITEPVYARFFNAESNAPLIQDVGSENIGRLLTLDALVVKRSEITPKVSIGKFKCSFCATEITARIDKDNVQEICPQCRRRSLKQINNESKFVNMQRIAVQDPLERLRGSTPTWHLEVWLEDDLVNTTIPGDRIDITGTLRIKPRKTFRGKEDKLLFTMYFESVSIRHKQKEFADLEISQDEERIIKEMSKDPQIFEKVAKSIAPSIYGHDEIKKALALQLFGGTPDKKLIDGGNIRSDIHILLIGDPGSAKTRLLQAVTSIVPKGIYVSGKSTSSAGLTAAAERDEFSEGGWTLKAGALVLGHGGSVSIDEFDKITKEDQSGLLEALESQTISVAKAGIVAKFSAKTSILAAANPKFGRFDPNQYPVDQFDIPPALMSRFDLIFPIKDVTDEETDRKIARHILTQYEAAGAQIAGLKEYEQVEKPPVDYEILRKYIAYARKNIRPRLTAEASKRIQDYYIELRKVGLSKGSTTITARQIEALVRLAEGSTKSRLSDTIELKDAELAISLMNFMLGTLATDRGGRTDIDIIMTGMPREKVNKINIILGIIKKLEQAEGYAKITSILQEAEAQTIDGETARRYLEELTRSGDLYSPKPGIVKIAKTEEE
ncbi:MAG: minichromosome maintenance protein MCM [Candidatus Micrarchaeota archaeon]|nr:minichromosome maintenance protein MCM [Candidatus Micrarchaeota archaeon]